MPINLDTDNTERELARKLPSYLPRGAGTGHRKLMRPIADDTDGVVNDLYDTEDAMQSQNATSIEQLWESVGKMLELPPNEGESLEHYRARLLAESQLLTSKGTPNDIIIATSSILEVSKESVEYEEPAIGSTENGTASVYVPTQGLDNTDLTEVEVASFTDRAASAGCRIEAVVKGTFTYITPTDYNSANFDASRGYDGLDTNGDPKDNGGTYAGLIG